MKDIGPILSGWDYSPNDLNVRIIKGEDGLDKIQMRIDLGILQMNMDGRPDGKRPFSFDTFLSFYKNEKENKKEFKLSPDDCFQLQQEGIQFYHRYLALFKLEDFQRVIRDTSHNVEIFDFVKNHMDNEEIIWSFQQYRPYVVMMNARAKASMSLTQDNFSQALDIIKASIKEIKAFDEENSEHDVMVDLEIQFLEQWAKDISENKPVSEKEQLEIELQNAIQNEEYELAAVFRDRLRSLDDLGHFV